MFCHFGSLSPPITIVEYARMMTRTYGAKYNMNKPLSFFFFFCTFELIMRMHVHATRSHAYGTLLSRSYQVCLLLFLFRFREIETSPLPGAW